MDREKSRIDISRLYDSLFWHAIYGILLWTWYRVLLFRCFSCLTLTESRILLLCIVVVSALLGYVIDRFIHKKDIHPFINMMIGFGTYTVLTYIKIRPLLVMILVATSVLLAVLNIVLSMSKRVPGSENRRKISIKCAKKAISRSKSIISLGAGVMIAVIGIPSICSGFIVKASVTPTLSTVSQEWTVQNHLEELSLFFDEEGWRESSLTTKLDTCQVLANICQAEWGTNELNVVASNTSGDIAGTYSDNEHLIIISVDHLMMDSGREVCNTVIHEAYHALEYRMVDAYLAAPDDMRGIELYDNAAVYMEEFENYQDCDSADSDDYYAYADQLCEKHARQWADYYTFHIENEIFDYLSGIDC